MIQMWKLILIILISVIATANNIASVSAWEFLGPPGGKITRILFDPEPNVIYAEGKFLFRSDNSGISWVRLNIKGDARIHQRTGKLLVFRAFDTEQVLNFSSDRGKTWRVMSTSLPPVFSKDLEFHSSNSSYIYAATESGLFISNNSGATFKKTSDFPFESCPEIEVSASNGNVAYVIGYGKQLRKTVDGGKSWFQPGNLPEEEVFCRSLAIDPIDSNVVYAGGVGKVFKTVDGGRKWSSIQCGCDPLTLAINPRNRQEILALNGAGVWRSTDGGTKWKRILNRSLVPGNFGRGFFTVAFNPMKDEIFVSFFPRGLFKSNSATNQWKASNRGISNLAIGQVQSNSFKSGNVFAVGSETPLIMYRSSDAGKSWRIITPGTKFSTSYSQLAVSSVDPEHVASHRGNLIAVSADGGENWLLHETPLINTAIMQFQPKARGTIFLAGTNYAGSGGFLGVGFALSKDFGKTWEMRNTGLTDTRIWALGINPQDGNHSLAATTSGIFETTNEGKQWTLINNSFANQQANSISFDSMDSNLLYLSFSGGDSLRSLDRGRSWQIISGLSSGVIKVQADPVFSRTVYFMVGNEIYFSTDAGNSVSLLDSSLPDYVRDISFTPDSILAATQLGVFAYPRLRLQDFGSSTR